jgi:hypothetical protein
MKPSTLTVLALVAGVLVVGIPYWVIPYGKLNLPDALIGPGLVVIALAALLLRSRRIASFWGATWILGLAAPIAVMARVVVDGMRDQTSHNLWPLEIIIALIVGGGCALLGAILGTAFLARR